MRKNLKMENRYVKKKSSTYSVHSVPAQYCAFAVRLWWKEEESGPTPIERRPLRTASFKQQQQCI
jgi:hypothetical protein